jgi:hypothetical protein
MPLPQLPYKRPFFAMTLSPHEIEVRLAGFRLPVSAADGLGCVCACV